MNAPMSNTITSTDFITTTYLNMEMKQEKLENNDDTIEAVELVSLLQCLGFQLQSFKKGIDADTQTSSQYVDNNDAHLQLEIACMKSHTKAILLKEKSGYKCKEDVLNSQFQQNGACSLALLDDITIPKSSLLPTISLDKSKKINALLLNAINILNEKDNENDENFTDLFEKSTSSLKPIPLENSKSELKNRNLKDYSLLPRKITNPILDSPNNSKYISLDSENACKLLETFRTVEEILLDAFNSSNHNSMLTKRVQRVLDFKPRHLVTSNQKWRSPQCSPNLSKTNSRCGKEPYMINVNRITTTRNEGRHAIPPSRIRLFEGRKTPSETPTSSRLLEFKKDSTPRSLNYKSQPVKLNLSTDETKSDSVIKSKIPWRITSFTNTRNT